MESLDKVIDAIKDCAFDLDKEENLKRSKNLLTIKIKINQKLFDLEKEYEKKKNELVISEEVQKGKNAEARSAMIELNLAGTDYDKIGEYKFLIGVARGVESHNENVLKMFFKE